MNQLVQPQPTTDTRYSTYSPTSHSTLAQSDTVNIPRDYGVCGLVGYKYNVTYLSSKLYW